MTTIDTYLLLRALGDELARCGMRDACTSPGSRNTPILLSLVREPGSAAGRISTSAAPASSRSGRPRPSGRPVAVTCTSGTAAANLAPAVIEAYRARRAADRAHRRPSSRTARRRRRPGDRSDQALRRRRQVVCRGRAADAVGRRRAMRWIRAARVPGLLDGRRGPARARCTSTCRCASRWCSTDPEPDDPRAGAPTAARGSPASAPRTPASPVARSLPARGVIVAGRDEGATRRCRSRPRAARARLPAAGRPAVGRPSRRDGDRHLRPAAA